MCERKKHRQREWQAKRVRDRETFRQKEIEMKKDGDRKYE